MAKQLMVYGYQSFRQHNGVTIQTREVCAVHSVAELSRITGISRHKLTTFGCETSNILELETAMREPGVVFFCPISNSCNVPYIRLDPKETK